MSLHTLLYPFNPGTIISPGSPSSSSPWFLAWLTRYTHTHTHSAFISTTTLKQRLPVLLFSFSFSRSLAHTCHSVWIRTIFVSPPVFCWHCFMLSHQYLSFRHMGKLQELQHLGLMPSGILYWSSICSSTVILLCESIWQICFVVLFTCCSLECLKWLFLFWWMIDSQIVPLIYSTMVSLIYLLSDWKNYFGFIQRNDHIFKHYASELVGHR